MLICVFKRLALVICFGLCSVSLQAATVQDSKGPFTLDYEPKRIVVLEFSFADALAAVGVAPIGIADDKDKSRVLPAVREVIGDWQSVGTRSQPSLEVIASLKPDLIIADISRHEAVYDDLQKIAPTLILPSRRETYEDNLKAATIIAKVVGKSSEMTERLAQHKQFMSDMAAKLPTNATVQFGVARADALFLHTSDSYAGGVIQALGMQTPDSGRDDSAYRQTSLEQLLAVNPEYFVVGNYAHPSIVEQWQSEPLWNLLQAVNQHHVFQVDPNVWSRCRGIMAAEHMASDLVRIFAKP
ncbi:Fe(3+) dicitrate ABC transporter substrate-binding protein [Marinomonas fungiae]|uniref:ABC-type Fe3+-citrate transport system, periplasmic component n=1 Tax=Marinomonas fungiae TaxID=1137284 RepID=A0A0K6IIB1_9GAMM|nr:Fe(3+) dicitrate ABC transporter substrate-binding protein [Marinomonas fungiae]CUB02845.1 ABC-type Fe3+-citrate transport system, periplasmic component [Marinomonas fungiae]